MEQIKIEELAKNPEQGIVRIVNSLQYGSYKANRGYGMTHEELVSIGIGNDQCLAQYNAEMGLN